MLVPSQDKVINHGGLPSCCINIYLPFLQSSLEFGPCYCWMFILFLMYGTQARICSHSWRKKYSLYTLLSLPFAASFACVFATAMETSSSKESQNDLATGFQPKACALAVTALVLEPQRYRAILGKCGKILPTCSEVQDTGFTSLGSQDCSIPRFVIASAMSFSFTGVSLRQK